MSCCLAAQVVDDVMSAQANLSTPEDDVNALIQQVGTSTKNLHVVLHSSSGASNGPSLHAYCATPFGCNGYISVCVAASTSVHCRPAQLSSIVPTPALLTVSEHATEAGNPVRTAATHLHGRCLIAACLLLQPSCRLLMSTTWTWPWVWQPPPQPHPHVHKPPRARRTTWGLGWQS